MTHKTRRFEDLFGFKNDINWVTSIFLLSYHSVAVYWCWHYAFPAKILTVLFAIAMYIISGLGITCGVHRLFTHRSYKTNTAVKLLMIICFSAAGQNSIHQWVRDHRLHHKFSDTDADPHNSKRGLFFCHIGWLMMKKNEEVRKQGKIIDLSDIESDKAVMLQDRYFGIYKLLFCYVIPTAVGIYLWNEEWKCAIAWQCFIRYLCVFHSELTVNSLAHTFGRTPYNKAIAPKENLFVTTITLGEGYHNYHHVFPYDYKAAETLHPINFSANIIKWLNKMGWVYDLKEASPAVVQAVSKRLGDGTLSFVEEKGR